MRRPRKLKMSWHDWCTENCKQQMQVYIRTPSRLMWMGWLREQYEAYRVQ